MCREIESACKGSGRECVCLEREKECTERERERERHRDRERARCKVCAERSLYLKYEFLTALRQV